MSLLLVFFSQKPNLGFYSSPFLKFDFTKKNVVLSLLLFVSLLPSPSALSPVCVPSLGFCVELSSFVDKDASLICTSSSSKIPHRRSGRLQGGCFFTLGCLRKRGLHIERFNIVINYDMPYSADTLSSQGWASW